MLTLSGFFVLAQDLPSFPYQGGRGEDTVLRITKVAENHTLVTMKLEDIDPEAWKIVDGKLYLNVSPSVAWLWKSDIPGNIAKGDKNWPSLVDK